MVLSRISRPDPLRVPIVPAREGIHDQVGDFLNVLVVLPAPHPGSPTPDSPLVSGPMLLVHILLKSS